VTGDWMGPRKPELIRAIQRVVFWRDRRWLQSHPVGAVLERDYVPGEFWSEHHFRALEGVTQVRVWWADVFGDGGAERGFIRGRQTVGGTNYSTHDAEDAANWMFLAGPPDDDVLPDAPIPPLPRAAWQPRSGLQLDRWPVVRWVVLPGVPAEAVASLLEAFGPALDDLTATTDIGLTVVVSPGGGSLDRWSALILPPEATNIEEARRLDPSDDHFGSWGSVDIRMLEPFAAAVSTVANAIQSFVIPRLWARTGKAEWPACPVHRSHPLWAQRRHDVAVWTCPAHAIEVPIGRLNADAT
jgi:hypothetical protein